MSDEGTTADATETESTPDPYAEQFQVMNQKLDSLTERLPSDEPDQPADLYSGLAGEDNFDGLSDEEVDAILNEGGLDEEGDLDAAAFDQFVSERVQDGIAKAMTPIREAETAKQLNALADKYPDIMEPDIFKPMRDFLADLVQRHQNAALATDPAMVEVAYQSVKAQRASADEVSAESAATGEASLETGAGPSQQGEADPADEYRRELADMARTEKGAF